MMNNGFGYWGWPFMGAFFGIWMIVAVLFLVFWIWMIVDVIQRKFSNTAEKVIWILVILFGHWIGSLIYFIVIKGMNSEGIFAQERNRSSKSKRRK